MSSPRPRLLLITASSPEIRRVRRARVLNFQQITMPYLAALVPDHWEVIHIDETVTPVDVALPVDLVGITFHTPSAFHVYELATQFRQRGIPVVLGGPHVTLVPDEAQQYADVIFVGEAEEHWTHFLRDFEQGRYDAATAQAFRRPSSMSPWHGRTCFIGAIIREAGCSPRAAVPMAVISARWP